MQHINAYLTFNGNCREAMTFYQDCLGGDLYLLTIGESPMAEKMPSFMKEYILHATLTKGNLVMMASDMVAENGLIKGNNVCLMLNCCTEKEIKTLYNKLAEGGQATNPLEETFWDAIFGNLIDKFGNYWLLNFDRNQ